jgi:hypothetical protein
MSDEHVEADAEGVGRVLDAFEGPGTSRPLRLRRAAD